MKRWRRRVAGALDGVAAASLAAVVLALWIWRAPAWPFVASAAAALAVRLWLSIAWRYADRSLANAEELVRWRYEEAQWQEVLAMLRRTAQGAGLLKRLLAPLRYRAEPDEPTVTLLETGAVFGGADWWRWDMAWRLSGAAFMRFPGAHALLLIQLRPRIPLDRWQEREIFAGRQLTLAIPVPSGEEARAARIAQYLDQKR